MKFIFNDRNQSICRIFGLTLKDTLPNLEVRCCDFEAIPKADYDFLLTPGNSYGQMTGGFDLAVRNVWPESESDVQTAIRRYHSGMLAVGSVVLTPLDPYKRKALFYTPTMRVPMSIVGTENVYWAYRAAFQSIKFLSAGEDYADSRILIPAFGTSAGHMDPLKAAMQCQLAYQHVNRSAILATTQQMFADHQAIAQWV